MMMGLAPTGVAIFFLVLWLILILVIPEFNFYLCSHAGIQGTCRPTHYHFKFWFPPAYYAHLAGCIQSSVLHGARLVVIHVVSVEQEIVWLKLVIFRSFITICRVSRSTARLVMAFLNLNTSPIPRSSSIKFCCCCWYLVVDTLTYEALCFCFCLIL